ncbi:flotillin [Diaminobutyricimonas aerilata]|uniref:Flotillin n=1 Tax=Diaminobutyricimonas aerilata TaxID=1162967 RepID=A0A2M9CMB7_9MICO|nr:SPFH domain-containing protein [Diaminobutyricimonas aerilata]PJJ73042.1 flotillin [Diaminobutyricimonas aerilata]
MDLSFVFGPVGLTIAGVAVALLVAFLIARGMYRVAAPDEAIIVTGRRARRTTDAQGKETSLSGQRVVHGSGVFVAPFFQKAFKVSLRSRAIGIQGVAQTSNGITIQVDAVAVVKIGDSDAAIRAAAQRFLEQDKQIDQFTQEVLSGSLRASIGGSTVKQIIEDRAALGDAVLMGARESLANQGLDVDSFQIKEISDQLDYISDLGRPEQALVRQAAEIAEAEADKKAQQARIAADEAIADANRMLSLKNAAIQLETDKAKAEAEAAKPLADARAQQGIIAERELTAQRQAQLREAELQSEIRVVADAEAYRIRQIAEAQAQAAVLTANADRDRRIAESQALRAEGDAEAEAILAKGKAEAEATRLRAEALSEESEALIRLRLVESLPEIARRLAEPMSNIDQLTVVSTDGASQLGKNVVSGVTQLDAMLSSTLGVGVKDLLGGFAGGAAATAAAAATHGNGDAAPAERS